MRDTGTNQTSSYPCIYKKIFQNNDIILDRFFFLCLSIVKHHKENGRVAAWTIWMFWWRQNLYHCIFRTLLRFRKKCWKSWGKLSDVFLGNVRPHLEFLGSHEGQRIDKRKERYRRELYEWLHYVVCLWNMRFGTRGPRSGMGQRGTAYGQRIR